MLIVDDAVTKLERNAFIGSFDAPLSLPAAIRFELSFRYLSATCSIISKKNIVPISVLLRDVEQENIVRRLQRLTNASLCHAFLAVPCSEFVEQANIVRLLDSFVHRNHQCLVFELLPLRYGVVRACSHHASLYACDALAIFLFHAFADEVFFRACASIIPCCVHGDHVSYRCFDSWECAHTRVLVWRS